MIKRAVHPRLAVFLLLVGLASCKAECQAGNLEPEKTADPAAAAAPTAAPTAAPAAAPAADQPIGAPAAQEGVIVCTQLLNGACQNPGTAFGADIPEFHAVLVTKQIPKTPKATVAWIAEDTSGAAPPNYRIAAKEMDLSGVDRTEATHVTIKGSLTRPDNGWPKGKYRVVVEMDGKEVASQTFTVGL